MISRTSIIFELMLCFDREVKTCQTGNTFAPSMIFFLYTFVIIYLGIPCFCNYRTKLTNLMEFHG